MSAVLAGAASGMFMGVIFVGVVTAMLFAVASQAPPILRSLLQRISPVVLMPHIAYFSIITWAVVGALLGILYGVVHQKAPGPGLGSSNAAYTLSITGFVVLAAPPLLILLRRVLLGLIVLMAAFIGIFGWLLPFLAR